LLRVVGPGLLVAATGVGAGDLATGAFSGSALGPAVLWAVLVGALMKYVLSEGLARWQLASGETLLEGALVRTARPLRWLFLGYLVPWSWFVGSALAGACGVTAQALVPLGEDPLRGKVIWGVVHSLLGLGLVLRGGFRLFERLMGVAIGVMFVTVVWTAVALGLEGGFEGAQLLRGLFVPSIPDGGGEGLDWTVGLIGGVGGTLTLLCYGYWIREEGREGLGQLAVCRLDLGVGFGMTALFGLAMVLIGSRLETVGKGSGLIVDLASELGDGLGPAARWAFLLGAWGAVFSSLVGVWQAVPYVFADFWRLRDARLGEQRAVVSTAARPYRLYLFALAFVPLLGLTTSFKQAQKAYAVVGAAFLPGLAFALLLLNRERLVGERGANRWLGVAGLAGTLAFFLFAAARSLGA